MNAPGGRVRGGCDRGARGGIGGACSWAGRTSAEYFFSSAASIVAESHLHTLGAG